MTLDPQTTRALRAENQRLKDEILQLSNDMARLQQMIHALYQVQYRIDTITAETNIVALIRSILVAALEAVGSENGSLMLLDEDTHELVFVDVIGDSEDTLPGFRIPADTGIAGWMLQEKTPVLVSDARHDKRWSFVVDEAVGFRTIALIGVPLFDGQRPLGVIEIVNPISGYPFQEGDLDILGLVGRLAALAIVRAENVAKDEATS